MPGDYPDIPFVQAAGDGGARSLTQMVVIHATDNTASDEAEASYATHRPDQISAHFYNDEDSVIQGVPLSHVAWGCYPAGNSRSVQFELCGLSNRLSDATLRQIAPIVRRVCDRYGIPIRHVGPADLRAGAKGICGHGDVTLAWGEGSHTDPGASFPWATFISYVNGSTGDNMFTPQQEADIAFTLLDGGQKQAIHYRLQVMRDQIAELTTAVHDLAAAIKQPTPVTVDAAAAAALAKAVNDDAAARLAQ